MENDLKDIFRYPCIYCQILKFLLFNINNMKINIIFITKYFFYYIYKKLKYIFFLLYKSF